MNSMEFDLQTAVIPVSVMDILSGNLSGGTHNITIDGKLLAIQNFSLCGHLKRIEDQLEQPWYLLNDATGSLKIAHTADNESIQECGAAKIIGNVRADSEGKLYIQAVTINEYNDLNVLSCHLLERKVAFKLHTKGLPPLLKEQHGLKDLDIPMSGPSMKTNQGNDPKDQVLEHIRMKSTIAFSELKAKFPTLDLDSILADLELEDGSIYDASGDDTNDKVYSIV